MRILDIRSNECLTVNQLNRYSEAIVNPDRFTFTSDKLQTFGLSEFIFEDTDSYNDLFTTKPLLDVLSKFPSVHTVAAYPGAYARCADVIKALLSHKGIRRIYQDCLMGVDRDLVMEMAREKGIEVLHCKKFMPSTFPYKSFAVD